ncbi:DUF4405 domain-containing protein [Bosea sp. BH3]|uniref:DUF4405 domain-containing protein n=1 Tax=Bosea sp. BH3 TaxID=2871701 RepID=UPI0021CB75AB|nr:DUF4405 domain-containing protein [Bosea sp. BH3]MCU4179681.1 DUF4405 domain-containing protein [Bosea sp. BH3]
MKPVFRLRLALDALAAALLLAALAYDWRGNVVHELIGTAMFALLIAHNVFNRRWYGTLARLRASPRSNVAKALNLIFLATMLELLVTSIIISQRAFFSFLPLTSTFTARQLHASAGYLVLIGAGLHVGLQWGMLMAVARRMLGITSESRVRTGLMRIATAFVAGLGIDSLSALGVGSKVLMQTTFAFWDFENDALAFFARATAIFGLSVALSHYAMRLLARMSGVKIRSTPVQPHPK